MKIEFKKVGFNQKEIKIDEKNLRLEGNIVRDNKDLVDLDATLRGNVEVECRRCGKEFTIPVEERLHLKLSDGVYRGSLDEADVVEFYDGSIDFDELMESERESMRLDYHLCDECKNKKE